MFWNLPYFTLTVPGNPKFGGTGYTMYIEFVSFRNTIGWTDFVKEISQMWMKIPGARIHWAKEWPAIKGFNDFMRKVHTCLFNLRNIFTWYKNGFR